MITDVNGVPRMKPWIKEAWVKALRSGEYDQADGVLCDVRRKLNPATHQLEVCGLGFCCLGVLTDLYAKEHGLELIPSSDPRVAKTVPRDKPLRAVEAGELLSTAVMRWAGLNSYDPMVQVERTTEDWETGEESTYVSETSLAELNDDGAEFHQIAVLIEAQL